MGTGFAKKKKQAKMMQDQMTKFQDQMQNSEYEGSAGNGLVSLTLTGDGEMKRLKINPDCVDPEDIEGLETLIKAAYKDAQAKIQAASPAMPNIPGMGGFPGF
jgi:nucleoid-associated protein EbfC